MKLLTLNTHSLMENDYNEKLNTFVSYVNRIKPDVIALQEIMQPMDGDVVNYSHINVGNISLKKGNHALNIAKELKDYNLIWCGFKKSYDMFDEGLAILTPYSVVKTQLITLSPFDDYDNWKTRKALGIYIDGQWFYSVHMGWWGDRASPFEYELNKLLEKMPSNSQFWLMGDFNSIASEKGKGYDLMCRCGLLDTYNLAISKDDGITASTNIDGWKTSQKSERVRIDYIFTNKKTKIDSSFTVFNGKNEKMVSDHFGVIVTTGEE